MMCWWPFKRKNKPNPKQKPKLKLTLIGDSFNREQALEIARYMSEEGKE